MSTGKWKLNTTTVLRLHDWGNEGKGRVAETPVKKK